jgi:hypothetical protein
VPKSIKIEVMNESLKSIEKEQKKLGAGSAQVMQHVQHKLGADGED